MTPSGPIAPRAPPRSAGACHFGATRLAELCQRLEDMGKAGALDGAAELTAEALDEYRLVVAALEAERNG